MKPFYKFNVILTVFAFIVLALSGFLSASFLFLLLTFFGRMDSGFLLVIFPMTSVFIGMFLSTAFSRRIVKPINDLISATNEVTKGNFDVWVESTDKSNELNDLIHSFNNMAKELESIEIFRNDFINNFSHEFKTPIVSIKGFAKQLQKDDLSKEDRKEFTDIIISESDRLTHMATNILLLNKYENQEILSSQTSFLLDEEIRKVLVILEKEWSQKELTLDLLMDEVHYTGNEEMLSQVWMNLISNAVKFSDDYGILTVRCFEEEKSVIVQITDYGIGMSEETVAHIFEKFYQGDLGHKAQGNGLGLSIVKRILNICGGDIEVQSAIGKGSTFIVRLPKNAADK